MHVALRRLPLGHAAYRYPPHIPPGLRGLGQDDDSSDFFDDFSGQDLSAPTFDFSETDISSALA